MYFPTDIWNEILDYIPKPYRKPLHLDAFKSIEVYREFKRLSRNIMYRDSLDDYEMYMCSSLYRFIMDDYTYCRRDSGAEHKWNPFMARYCTAQSLSIEELDLGYGDRQRIHGRWGVGTHYDKKLTDDFTLILDHIQNIESTPWW